MGLCQTDNKFVSLRPLHPMANNLPARKIAIFGRLKSGECDKKAGGLRGTEIKNATKSTSIAPDTLRV